MPHQLIFTSVPEGLQPGSRGFTTVACSAALSPPMISRLESMSVYKPAFGIGDPNARMNPVLYAYRKLQQGNDWLPVLTRSAPAGTDYSGRSNTFTHHILPSRNEIAPAGPTWLCQQAHLFHSVWDGQPRHIENQELNIPLVDTPTEPCNAWEKISGDAGWGGALTAAHFNAPNTPVYLLYRPGTDVLSLIAESVALLPPQERWQATFNTYWTSARQDVACRWRCVMAGGPGQQSIPRNAEVIDITQPLRRPLPGPATDAARAGLIWDKHTGLKPRATAPPPLETSAQGTTTGLVEFDLADDVVSTRGQATAQTAPKPPPLHAGTTSNQSIWQSPWPWITLTSMTLVLGAVGYALITSKNNSVADQNQQIVLNGSTLDPEKQSDTGSPSTAQNPPTIAAQGPEADTPLTTDTLPAINQINPVAPPKTATSESVNKPPIENVKEQVSVDEPTVDTGATAAAQDVNQAWNGPIDSDAQPINTSIQTPSPSPIEHTYRLALSGSPKTDWSQLPARGFAEQSLYQFTTHQQGNADLGKTSNLKFAFFLPADDLLTYRLLDGGKTLSVIAKDLLRLDRHLGDFRFEQDPASERVQAIYTPGNPDASNRLSGLRLGLMDKTDRLLLLAINPASTQGHAKPLVVGPIKPIVPVTETQAHQTARFVMAIDTNEESKIDSQGRIRFGDGGYVELAKRRQVTQRPSDPDSAWFIRSELSELQQLRKAATAITFNQLLDEYRKAVESVEAVEIVDSFNQVVRRYPVVFDTARNFKLKIDPRRQRQQEKK